MYIKNRRNSDKIRAFGSCQTLYLTESLVFRNRILFLNETFMSKLKISFLNEN